ncbi:hypothetical protein [Zavarzinia aquatilis]|uniref:Uncharacterized protein n=1 Tax=Zavarzinia aquatilis TaxID=2211142 RepID=A0A317DXG8_9PROT|nr:hypothetical protein [Zavarzinia aquatilis]PWR18630.1 hypothetical protein DKG74_18570 [Zavarzinia aquatilis]
MVELREEVVAVVATSAVDNDETGAVRDLLRPEAELLSLYDRLVAAQRLIVRARKAAPPVAVNGDFLARMGLAEPPAVVRPRHRPLWLVAAGLMAAAIGAVTLLTPADEGHYAPAGAGPVAAPLPDRLTLPDGEVLAARADAVLAQLPCRVFASAETRAIACLANDGTQQTILLEP